MFYKTLPLNDNTDGFRFDIAGVKGLTRKRVSLKRYGVTEGETMRGFHMGKRSVYIQKRKPVRHLHDFALRELATALGRIVFDFK